MMKTLSTLMLILVLGYMSVQTGICQQNDFKISIDRSTITVKAGETAEFNISVIVPKEFDASVFLSVSPDGTQIPYSEISLSPKIINAPYTAKLTVKTTANYSKGELFEFRITATNNAQLTTMEKCYLNILPTKPRQDSNWRFLPTGEQSYFGIPAYITQDGAGNYWYAAKDLGFRKITGTIYSENWLSPESTHVNITFVPPIVDVKSNKIWIPSYRDGLVRYSLDGKNQTVYNTQNSPIPDDRIMAMAIDTINSKSTLWIGTRIGLARFTGTEWTVFDSTNSVLGKEQIKCIVISDSIVWVGTRNGLAKYDGTSWTRFTPENSSMPAAFVHVLAAEKNGNLWMGLSPKGVYINDKAQPNIMVGLVKFDGKEWTLFDSKNSPMHTTNFVNSIAIDKNGSKWIATASHTVGDGSAFVSGAGIMKYNDTSWTVFNKENSLLPDNNINWLYVDNGDNIWFHEILYDKPEHYFWGVFNENGLPSFFTSIKDGGEKGLPDGITVFPNPSGGIIKIMGIEGNAAIRVMNSLGVEVLSMYETSGKVEIDVSGIASGLYFVSIRNNSGRTIVKPVMVSH